jgi:hypothetical protein
MKTNTICKMNSVKIHLIVLLLSVIGLSKMMAQPTGAINGVFSVSAGNYVYFSQGNLQYQASTNTWRFASKQWDYVGEGNNNMSSSYSEWIDLFGWGTSGYNHGATCYQPWSTSQTNSAYYAYGSSTYNLYDQTGKADWGYNAISNGGNYVNAWRTLTKEEWDYVLNTRTTNSGIRYARAQVNGINGIILLPDDWDAGYYGFNDTNNSSASFTSNTINSYQWNALEYHGAVFLPTAGHRLGTASFDVGSYGCYWSASYSNSSYAYYLICNNNGITMHSFHRCYGNSVRLVRTAQAVSYYINVTLSPSNGGTVSGSGSYQQGSTCTLTAMPNTGYSFVRWIKNSSQVSTNPTYSFVVTENATYVAEFSLNNYAISTSTSPSAGGSVSGAGNYNYGSNCTLTASANTGYSFVRWTRNGSQVSTSATYSFTVTESATYVAEFSLNNYTISASASPSAGGMVSGAGNYNYGSNCTLTASPNTGYSFVRWTKNGSQVSTNPTYNFNVTENANYVANFSLNSYTISTSASPSVGGSVNGGGNYNHGSSCTLTAVPNTGYTFSNWTKNGQQVSTNPSYNFTVTESASYVANFTLNTYQINASASPSNGGTVSGTGTYNFGASVTLSATASTGYTFSNWTKNGQQVSTNPSYNFMVTESASYVANFTLNTYQINVSANPSNGGTVSGTGTYNFGASVTLSATASTGYTFSNWTKNGQQVSTNPTYSFTVAESASYVANFSQNSYTISAWASPSDGGTVSGDGNYNYGASCTLTATANAGYNFTNWTKNGTVVSTSSNYNFAVTESASYVANFSQNSYTISALASPSDGGTVSGGGSYNHGASCTLTATANAGYTFTNWTKNGQQVSTSASYTFTVMESANYVANFNQDSYTISASANPSNGGTVSGGGSYNHGASCILTAMANTGYTFSNWTENGTQVSANASYSFTVTGNRTFVANFTANPVNYTISASANPSNGGTVSGGGSYQQGSYCTLTATANVGYNFTNWTKNGTVASSSPTYNFIVTESASYVANFSQNSYTVSVSASPSNGGTVSGGGSYNHGVSCTLTATANAGYTFTNWTKNGQQVSTSASYTFTVTENASYVANFSQNSYTISASANPSNGGTVSGGGSYNHGSNCTLTASSNTGYTFTNWTKNGQQVSTSASYTFTVTENASYVANFSQNSYTISASANPSNGGTVSGGGSYNHGSNCTLTASSNTGYTFTNWTKNGQQVSTSASYTFTVTESASYVANFSQNSYTISASANPSNGGSVSGGGSYSYGASCMLTAIPNEDYTFVNWTMDGEEVSTEAIYSFTVTEDATFVANFESSAITQTTSLDEGWNWWSCYVDLEGIDGLGQIEASLGDNGVMIKSRNDGFDANYGSMWVGSLDSIYNGFSYLILTNAACEMTITGNAATPSAHPITLPVGWSWIGYPCTSPMTVSEALSGLTPMENDLVKSRESFAVYTPGIGWLGTLQTIEPGMGLMFESHNMSPVTLIYPNPSKSEALLENITAKGNHWEPEMQGYAQNMSVMATIELDDDELQSGNYELAAFANGECRGSVRLMYVEPVDRYIAFLTITGEDVTALGFSLYDTMTGEEIHEAQETLNFSNNATVGDVREPYVIRFRGTTGTSEWASGLSVYPNPVRRGEKFSLCTAEGIGEVQVEIINAFGQTETLRTMSLQTTITAPNVAGVYTLRITKEGKGVCYRKLIVR